MRVIEQQVGEIIENLSPLDVEWMDDTAGKAIAKLAAIGVKSDYSRSDVEDLLANDFDEGLLCCRLFLALSKDTMEGRLRDALGAGGIGIKRFQSDRMAYLDALEGLGLLHDMASIINHKPVWSDILVERLRSGRGSAIQGQKRGRGLEDFAEQIVK
ncbi:DpnII family type II restriction endonuclease, partial [Methylobacterium sp. CM6247]